MGEKIRLLVADDHPIVRRGLAALIETQDDLELVGEAEDGDEAVKLSPPRCNPARPVDTAPGQDQVIGRSFGRTQRQISSSASCDEEGLPASGRRLRVSSRGLSPGTHPGDPQCTEVRCRSIHSVDGRANTQGQSPPTKIAHQPPSWVLTLLRPIPAKRSWRW
jgi:hypothetical protein